MDYALLLDAFTQAHAARGWPRQRLLHACLRAAIRDGTLAAGTRLAATRTLAGELGIARNTVLYAYEQLASEGFVVSDRRGTVVAAVAAVAGAKRGDAPPPPPQVGLSRRARACADEGDTVWIENPGYGGALAAFRGAGLAIEGIDVDLEGMAPTPHDWQVRRPKLVYVTPSHQYPVGVVMSLARRLALIEAARHAGALIVEDDYDSEFRHEGPPLAAMQGLAPDAPVLYCGTFSKTMFPGLRIGFVVAPPGLAKPLAAMRAQSSAAGRAAEQLALAGFLRSGEFMAHLRRMRRLYRQRRDALAAALARHLGRIAEVHGASAGMHLSLRLPDERLSDVDIASRAREEGIIVNPLSTHAVEGGSPWNGLMLGYAQVPAEQMDALVRRLAAVVYLAAYGAGAEITPAGPDRPANRSPSARSSPSAPRRS